MAQDSLSRFFLGERARDVQLDPRFASASAGREQMRQQAMRQAFQAGPTEGERAARAAGQAAQQQMAAAQRASAAGVRGPGALFALQSAQRATTQGAQDIAGQTARTAAEARRIDQQSALDRLERTLSEQEKAAERERLMREQQRQQGMLGVLGALGGTAIGGKLGGMGGAQAGAGLGSAAGRSLEAAFR